MIITSLLYFRVGVQRPLSRDSVSGLTLFGEQTEAVQDCIDLFLRRATVFLFVLYTSAILPIQNNRCINIALLQPYKFVRLQKVTTPHLTNPLTLPRRAVSIIGLDWRRDVSPVSVKNSEEVLSFESITNDEVPLCLCDISYSGGIGV